MADNGGYDSGGMNEGSTAGVRIGDSYVDWLLTAGRDAARQLLPDPTSKRIRTPVLIAFTGAPWDGSPGVTIEDIRDGRLDFGNPDWTPEDGRGTPRPKKEDWVDGFFIPDFFFTFNDTTKLLRRDGGEPDPAADPPAGLVDESRLVMAFASDMGLKLWDHEVTTGSPLTRQIVDVFAGPALDPFKPEVDGAQGQWDQVSKNICDSFNEYKNYFTCSLKHDPAAELRTAITAVIDDGFAFANRRFRFETTTAFQYLWRQSDPAGDEFRRRTINDMLTAAAVSGVVDEEKVYRDSGILDFGRPNRHVLGYPATHGTPVLDLACGHPPTTKEEVYRRLVMAVEVPTEAVRDTTLTRLHPYIFAGIIYLLMRLVIVTVKWRELFLTLRPMMINISFGNTAGPHDGLSPFEIALDTIARRWTAIAAPLAIVLGSGNSHLTRGHARATLAAPGGAGASRIVLPWRVLPDDKTDSAVEIWLPEFAAGSNGRVQVKVLPPGVTNEAGGTPWLLEGSAEKQVIVNPGGNTILLLSYRVAQRWNHYIGRSVTRGVLAINLAPTESLDANPDGSPKVPLAPAGLWTIIVERVDASAAPLEIRAWIQRDDTPFTFRRLGRQSYFDMPSYERFDEGGRPVDHDGGLSTVKRGGNMSAIATGYEPVVVGGLVTGSLNRKRLHPSRYSAGGPTSTLPPQRFPPPERDGPDVSAISDDTPIHRGVIAAGTMGGSVGIFSGTSMAAPQVTRALVALAETGAIPDRSSIRQESTPFPLPGAGGNLWPEARVGVGSIAVDPLYPERFDP